MKELIEKLANDRRAFLALTDLIKVGNFETTRNNDILNVISLSVDDPEKWITYFPNGAYGDVCKVSDTFEDLQTLLNALIVNDVPYAVYRDGRFEAGKEPNSQGEL